LLPLISADSLPKSGIPSIMEIAKIGSLETKAMLTIIGFTVLLAFAFFTLIQSIVRMAKNKAKMFGLILPLIALIGIAITIIGIGSIEIIPIVFAVLSILLLLFNIIGAIAAKKNK
jgi:Na+-transporting methylmalonyl-CoA/oxaloacetate decarboxylase gamma subunit